MVSNIEKVLDEIRRNHQLRAEFIRQLAAFETNVEWTSDVREQITGPLANAVFAEGEVLRKRLSNGLQFEFLYRSKIARDFVLSNPSEPDHVWEPQTTKLILDVSRSAKQLVIGGAYFGDHAVLVAASVAENGGVVHAFEPNDEQRAMLTRNAEINKLGNLVTCHEGLWSNSSSRLKLVGYDSVATSELISSNQDGISTTTIADYLGAAGIGNVDVIVLDLEGAELSALAGAQVLLRKTAAEAPIIVFEVHRTYVDWTDGLEATDIGQLLVECGYKLFAIRDLQSNYDMSGRPVELIPAREVYLDGPPHGFNMVAVKDVSIFDERSYRFVSGVSPKLLRHKDRRLHHPAGGF